MHDDSLTAFLLVFFLQAPWSTGSERWSLERGGSCSLFMTSMMKLEGEPAFNPGVHILTSPRKAHGLCVLGAPSA